VLVFRFFIDWKEPARVLDLFAIVNIGRLGKKKKASGFNARGQDGCRLRGTLQVYDLVQSDQDARPGFHQLILEICQVLVLNVPDLVILGDHATERSLRALTVERDHDDAMIECSLDDSWQQLTLAAALRDQHVGSVETAELLVPDLHGRKLASAFALGALSEMVGIYLAKAFEYRDDLTVRLDLFESLWRARSCVVNC
jgi:hypothetical protein